MVCWVGSRTKKDGRVRICVDLTQLNKSVQRERHQLLAVEQVLAQLTGAKVFSKLDANSGFWQIPLAPESALLTTFITRLVVIVFNVYHLASHQHQSISTVESVIF